MNVVFEDYVHIAVRGGKEGAICARIFGHSICQFKPKYLVKTFFGDTTFTSGTASPVTLSEQFIM